MRHCASHPFRLLWNFWKTCSFHHVSSILHLVDDLTRSKAQRLLCGCTFGLVVHLEKFQMQTWELEDFGTVTDESLHKSMHAPSIARSSNIENADLFGPLIIAIL